MTSTEAVAGKPQTIFRTLEHARIRDEPAALVTLVGTTGSSARSVGSHMAVLGANARLGSFSAGCVDEAVAAEARDCLAAGRPRLVRFGHGSPYIDIRLPCGGGMDLLFLPDLPASELGRTAALLESRAPVALALDGSGRFEVAADRSSQSFDVGADTFLVRHVPTLRILVIGQGEECVALMRLALAHGAEIELLSADDSLLSFASAAGIASRRLVTPSSIPTLHADPWSAVVLLFHDHDWEAELLAAALATPAFWIGAMGSRRTQEARRAALAVRGLPQQQIERIKGPIGLIPSARDPATLALSALAEIVGAYQESAT